VSAAAEQNLELKARCPRPAAARAAVLQLDLRAEFVEQQTDTYFLAARGRLKLREIDGQTAVLIWYDRPDAAQARTSSYRRAAVADPGALKAALAAGLGIRGAVRKQREIYLWHNVRIHLDHVADLGSFLEFEAVLTGGGDPVVAQERLDRLCVLLGVSAADRLAVSYADLLGI